MGEFTTTASHYSGNTEATNEAHCRDLNELQQENQEIVAEYITELYQAEPVFHQLLNQLMEGLATSQWDTIIGDDVRGRATALIIGKVAQNYTTRLELPSVKRIFVATGKHDMEGNWQLIESYLESIRRKLGNRVLFTTEYIDSGETAQRTIIAFQRLGVTCDVASAYLAGDGQGITHREEMTRGLRAAIPGWQGALYVGEESPDTPRIGRHIFKLYDVMGVKKSSGPTTIATGKLEITQAQAHGASQDEIAQLQEVQKLHAATIIKPIRQGLTHLSNRLSSVL